MSVQHRALPYYPAPFVTILFCLYLFFSPNPPFASYFGPDAIRGLRPRNHPASHTVLPLLWQRHPREGQNEITGPPSVLPVILLFFHTFFLRLSTLRHRDGFAWLACVDRQDMMLICMTRHRHLASRYWGSITFILLWGSAEF